MNTELIKSAINSKRQIEFKYQKEGGTLHKRIGNPHALFIDITKEGEKRLYLDLVQTGGQSKKPKDLPAWRVFIVDYMSDVILLDEYFETDKDYNPKAVRYSKIIAKI